MNRTEFRYAQSHQNDPLGAAVVEKVIEVINDEKLIQRSDDYGNYFLDKIEKIKDSSNIIKEVRGRGLMIAIELNTNAETVQKELLKRKFIVAKRFGQETLRLDPALTIKENDIDLFLATFKQVLRSI
jgi:acetylornithine aminotransferase